MIEIIYSCALMSSGVGLLAGVFISLFLFMVEVITVEEWLPSTTEEVLFPLKFCLFLAGLVATLGLPLLLYFLYKCKKLFWSKK